MEGDWKDKLKAIKIEDFAITDEKLIPGRIIELELNRLDGLIIADQYESRIKYIIILGVDSDKYIYGNVLINTNNYNFTDEMADHQYPINQEDYTGLLDHKSYVDCSQIFEIDRTRLKKFGIYKGMVTNSDFKDIVHIISNSELITPKEKKKFNLE